MSKGKKVLFGATGNVVNLGFLFINSKNFILQPSGKQSELKIRWL